MNARARARESDGIGREKSPEGGLSEDNPRSLAIIADKRGGGDIV